MNSPSTESPEVLGGRRRLIRAIRKLSPVAVILLLLLTLPLLVDYLWFCLAFNHGQLALPSLGMWQRLPMPTATSVGIFVGWLVFQAVLQICMPGRWVNGSPQPDGTQLRCKMNGWLSWWLTWAVLAAGVLVYSPTKVADQFGPLLTTANVFAYLFCLYLFRR